MGTRLYNFSCVAIKLDFKEYGGYNMGDILALSF